VEEIFLLVISLGVALTWVLIVLCISHLKLLRVSNGTVTVLLVTSTFVIFFLK